MSYQEEKKFRFEGTTYHSSLKRKTHKRIHRTKDGKEVVEMVQDDVVVQKDSEGEGSNNNNNNVDKKESDSENDEKKKSDKNENKEKPPMLRAKKTTDSSWPAPRLTKESTVILVLSARKHVELRQVIRETWGSGHDNIYFVIGQYCPVNQAHRQDLLTCETPKEEFTSINQHQDHHDEWYTKRMELESQVLREEQAHYRDMLWTPSPESYRGLPHKIKEGYHWVVHNLPNTKWIVKADDDTIVRVKSLGTYLDTLPYTKPTIIGKIEYEGIVFKEGRWKELKYPREKYPPFPLGSCGHAVSRPVAQYIAQHKATLTEYQGEDTSLSIWMDESPLKVDIFHSESFENDGKCENPNSFVIGHDLSIERIRECYGIGDEVQPITVKQF